MSDSKSMFEGDVTRKSIRNTVARDMSKGFGAAAAVVIAIGLAIWILYILGTLLPEESREAPDPSYGLQIESSASMTV